MFYLDYRAPVGIIRDKLTDIVKDSKHWDRQVVKLQVTDTKKQTIELRCIMSANSAGQTFDLRCEVREKLIEFLQREHPEALPRQRSEAVVSDVPNAKAARPKLLRKAAATGAAPS